MWSRFIDSTPSRETSVVRPVCAPCALDYDEIWKRSPSDKAMAAMVASEVAERLMKTPERYKYQPMVMHHPRPDLCKDLWKSGCGQSCTLLWPKSWGYLRGPPSSPDRGRGLRPWCKWILGYKSSCFVRPRPCLLRFAVF